MDWRTRTVTAYCHCVIVVAAVAGACLFIAAGLAWTARQVHIGTLDALELAGKLAVAEPVSALDWPELHLRALAVQPGALVAARYPYPFSQHWSW